MTFFGSNMEKFDDFFERLSGERSCHGWQHKLADQDECANRLIRIPTGFGKTLGVLAAWVWHRIIQENDGWPRRLVWCLPMRVLVEQTEEQVRSALKSLGVLWDGGKGTHDGKVGVHLLMGGANAGRWHLYPECNAVLIGTQDMLLSRALNRGYASPRARWPMEFGLLNHDALWVMDEVQLMDVGLATSGQLQVFRDEDQADGKSLRPCFTWWMSATLQRTWLGKSPETTSLVDELDRNTHCIESRDRTGHLWDVAKFLERKTFHKANALAHEVSQRHRERGCGKDGPTLVVLNTVKLAVETWQALKRDQELKKAVTDIRLIHSRFRPTERQAWREEFLNREACGPEINRIIVATQVVEAGVDISAFLLVTELAPWPSLVQRFGRCARWGGTAQVLIADFDHKSDKQAAPYAMAELNAAREACDALRDVGPTHLERFEEENKALLPCLYPYEPKHLLLRHELDELFDTSPDLSGADIDISRFIRSGEERDVHVFWTEVDGNPSANLKPTRDELCSVPFLEARKWLCPSGESLKNGIHAWVWDWLSGQWRTIKRRDIVPGQTLLVESHAGGYCSNSGWAPTSHTPVESAAIQTTASYENRACWTRKGDDWCSKTRRVRTLQREDHADGTEEDESLSVIGSWQTIATHGLQVGREVERIAAKVLPAKASLLHLAGRWHDLGKAHPAFQASIKAGPEGNDIAKAPDRAWPCNSRDLYRINTNDQRSGFRHELASTLGLFGVLQRHEPQHPALLGPWEALFNAMGKDDVTENLNNSTGLTRPTEIEREILDLDADGFDLLAYLVCAHHGKVRMTWHASRADQEADDRQLRIRGIRQGDELPSILLAAANGEVYPLPATALDLSPSETGLSLRTGRSWTERVLNLLACHGPFTLAWLEALLRAADQRASGQAIEDTLLQEREEGNADHHLDEGHRALAQPAAGRATAPTLGGNSPSCGQLHGHGGRVGGRGLDSETTRLPDSETTHPPASATRYVETRGATLRYQDLVPLLGERVAAAELSIFDREFAAFPLHDLLLQLHRCVCVDLIPEIAGCWRREDVRVGNHKPPLYWEVPMLMRSYADDLEVRLADLTRNPGEQKAITDFTFAEGRLLHIHPFKDFNGRVSRLFLIELLCRLDLSVVASSIASPAPSKHYFAALRAYDRHDPGPLTAIWRRRFALEAG